MSNLVIATAAPLLAGSTRKTDAAVDDPIQLVRLTTTGHVAPARPTGRAMLVVPGAPEPASKVKHGRAQHVTARFSPHAAPGESNLNMNIGNGNGVRGTA